MRTTLSILLVSLSFVCRAAVPNAQLLSRVDNQVDAMFKDLSIISNKTSSSASEKRANFAEKYFKVPDQPAPNEFKILGFDKEQYRTDIAARRYVNTFFEMFRAAEYEDYSFKYERRNSKLLPPPEFKAGESTPEIAQVVVRKVYYKAGTAIAVFEDTLIVGVKELEIRKWANKSSHFHIGNFGEGEILNFEQMKSNASLAYSFKQYRKAYSLYQDLIEKYPDEGEPYYRMAVMLYKKEYGTFMSKKDRNKLILDYLDKAKAHGTSTIRSCADNMKYWITC